MTAACDLLILRSSAAMAGIERRLLLMAQTAAEAGLHPVIAALHRAPTHEPAEHPLVAAARRRSLEACSIPDPGPLSPSPLRALISLLRRCRPVVVHTQDYRSDILGWCAAHFVSPRPRLLATIHGHTGASARLRHYERADRRVLAGFDHLIAVSHWQAEDVHRWGIPETRVEVIPNFIEPGWEAIPVEVLREDTRRALGIPPSAPLLGFFGRNSPEKGLDVALDALAHVRAHRPEALLLAAGEGMPPHAPEGALFLPFQEDIRALMCAADLVVVPSRREAFGMTALEALVLGRPLIATRVGGLEEMLADASPASWRVPAGDAPALAAAILHALEHREESGRAAQQAGALLRTRFGPGPILARWIAVYRSLMEDRGR